MHLDRYPTTVATLSRRAKDIIEAGFEHSVDEDHIASMLQTHSFVFG